MNATELAALLTQIQVLDNRNLDKITLEAWTPIVGDLDYRDALDAVNTHFRTSGDYLKPYDVVSGVRRIHEARAHRISFSPIGRGCRVHRHPDRDDYTECREHHFEETSGWCTGSCGWREDHQSEYNYNPNLGHTEPARDWAA